MPRLRIVTALVVLAALVGTALPVRVAALPNERGQRCASPVGVWRARADKPAEGIAEIITVKLEQTAAGLVGTASTDYWTGAPGSMPPAACAPGSVHRVLDAPMTAQLHGDQLSWMVSDAGAITEHAICGGPSGGTHGSGGSFGHVDLARGMFVAQFVVNSGRRPLLYLHISCS